MEDKLHKPSNCPAGLRRINIEQFNNMLKANAIWMQSGVIEDEIHRNEQTTKPLIPANWATGRYRKRIAVSEEPPQGQRGSV